MTIIWYINIINYTYHVTSYSYSGMFSTINAGVKINVNFNETKAML